MKRAFILLMSVLLLSGCATVERSHINPRMLLHDNFPERVGVFPFTGQQPYAEQATDLFSMGLISIPYFQEVVERNKMGQVMRELGYQYSGFVDEKSITELGKHLGLDAIFTGNVVTHSDILFFNSKITIKLIDVKTGIILWGCNAQDERAFATVNDVSISTELAVKNALRDLKKDFKKIKKVDLDIKKKTIEDDNKKTIDEKI